MVGQYLNCHFLYDPWLSPATEGPPLLSQSVCVFCGLRRGGQRADTDKSFQQSRAGSARWGRGREHTPSLQQESGNQISCNVGIPEGF